MRDLEVKRFEMCNRVREFGVTYPEAISANTYIQEIHTKLSNKIAEIETHIGAQMEHGNVSRSKTVSKAVAKENLLDSLKAIRRTAKLIDRDRPGFDEEFTLSRQLNESTLLNTAKIFLKRAQPSADEFIKYLLPTDFLEDLEADIEAFEEAISVGDQALSHRIVATTGIEEAMAEAMDLVDRLNGLIRNRYRDNALMLSAWNRARHVEKVARKPKPSPEPADA